MSFRGLSRILEIIKSTSNMMISDSFLAAVYLVNTTALPCLVFYEAETVAHTFLVIV